MCDHPSEAAGKASVSPAAAEGWQTKMELFDTGRGEAVLSNPGGRFHGWCFKRHPDGYYVSHGRLPVIPEPWGPELAAAPPSPAAQEQE